MTDSNDKKPTMLYRRPELYDALYSGFVEDVPFYRDLALRTGGPALELACGSGRVTVPLARAGVSVTGVDLSPEMIGAARRRAAGELGKGRAPREGREPREPLEAWPAGAPRFLVGDMRDPLPDSDSGDRRGPPFGLVFIPLHSLSHLLEEDDVLRCLRSARSMLRPEGLLALAVHNPDPAVLAREPDALYPVTMPPVTIPGDSRYSILESTRYDRQRRVLDVRWWVDMEPLDFSLRLFSPRELEDCLVQAGFELVERWGWYDCSPFTEECGTQIVVARKVFTSLSISEQTQAGISLRY
ncbi:MAG: class I SAM-dependent methyltransferase [Spirochaetaceae bacterium]|nr:MAG: class I SAM-dependent methyltransferase [Spirochaetaceae bacterium]